MNRPKTYDFKSDGRFKSCLRFKRELNSKSSQLAMELMKMREETFKLEENQRLCTLQIAQAHKMASELNENQIYLSGMHVALDKINMGLGSTDIEREKHKLKKINEENKNELERILLMHQVQREKVNDMRSEIQQILAPTCSLMILKDNGKERGQLNNKEAEIEDKLFHICKLLTGMIERKLKSMTQLPYNSYTFQNGEKVNYTSRFFCGTANAKIINPHTRQFQKKITDLETWFSKNKCLEEYTSELERKIDEKTELRVQSQLLREEVRLKKGYLDDLHERFEKSEMKRLIDSLSVSSTEKFLMQEYLTTEHDMNDLRKFTLKTVGRINKTLCVNGMNQNTSRVANVN